MPNHLNASLLTESFGDAVDPIESRIAFCSELKAARTRRGVSLEDIAAVTKVCVSYFEALERGDLTYWPKAIFRRAFFRGYVEMIGLPVDEWIREFSRLFPDAEAPAAVTPAAPAPSEAPRLALDASWHGSRPPIVTRIMASMLDVTVVLAVSALAWLAGANLPVSVAVVTVIYFALARIVIDESPAALALRSRRAKTTGEPPTPPVVQPAGEPTAVAHSDEADQSEKNNVVDLQRRRKWTSDARRVRPREERPRVRVRFK